MASRIVATFSRRDVKAFGVVPWRMLQDTLTPALNLLAGEAVLWVEGEDTIMVLASLRADEVVHASDCALNNGPAMAARPCDCGAEFNSAAPATFSTADA